MLVLVSSHSFWAMLMTNPILSRDDVEQLSSDDEQSPEYPPMLVILATLVVPAIESASVPSSLDSGLSKIVAFLLLLLTQVVLLLSIIAAGQLYLFMLSILGKVM